MRRTTLTLILAAIAAAPLTAQETTVTGTVVGPDGEGVAGATVGVVKAFMPPFEWETGTTDEDGRFEFTLHALPPYRVTFAAALAEGYAAGAAVSPGDAPVEVKLSRETASISGTVRDEDGRPIEGARVEAMMLQREGVGDEEVAGFFVDWEHAPSVLTDAEGHFTLGGLPPGVHAMLAVAADGFATFRDVSPRGLPLTGQGEELAYTLRPGGAIAGRVTCDGEPVADAMVRAVGVQEDAAGWGTARTDAEGRYEIRDIAGGTYVVSTHGGPEDLLATPVEDVRVEAGERTEDVDIELTSGAVVRGRVRWEDTGEPVAGVTAGSYRSMGGFHQTQTDEDGAYELRLPPGEHRVTVINPREDARGAEPGHYEVSLGLEAVVEGIDFTLTRKRRIVLTVLDPDGQPAVGVSVLWSAHQRYERPGTPEPIVTGEDGRVELLFGREVAEWPSPLSAAVAQDPERDLAGIALVHGENDTEATIRLQPGAWLEATAQTREGEPLADIGFRLEWERDDGRGHLPMDTKTADDGRARLGPLPTGVTLRVSPSWEHQESTLEPAEDAMPSMELQPGETREVGPFVMAPEGLTVRGTVIDAAGEPVEGAVVVCDRGVSREGTRTETDAEGRFVLTGVSASEEVVTVIAASPDGSAAWAEPVDPSIAFEPTLQLGTPGTVVATIKGADGRPAQGIDVELHPSDLRTSTADALPGGLRTWARNLRTDAEGRVRIEGLVPGVEYALAWRSGPDDETWHGSEFHMIYGDGEVLEVDMTMGE